MSFGSKQQIGISIGGFFTSDNDIDGGFGFLEDFVSGFALSVRYQYWVSDQLALGLQIETLGELGLQDGTNAYQLVIQYKPASWEVSSRSFFTADLGLGGYTREWRGLTPSRTSRGDSKSETVFGGYAGLGYHWLMTDHWVLSLNARYHVTGDWDVLTKEGTATMNANGFASNLEVSLLW